MCRAPITTVLMAALLGAAQPAPAHKVTAASALPPAKANLDRPVTPDRTGTSRETRSNAVLTSEQNAAPSQTVASAYRDIDRMAPVRTSPPANPAPQEDSDWRYTAAMLGTLAIIATIAVRRRKAGTPWA